MVGDGTITMPILGMREMQKVQGCAQGHTADCGLPLNLYLLPTINHLLKHKECSRKTTGKKPTVVAFRD